MMSIESPTQAAVLLVRLGERQYGLPLAMVERVLPMAAVLSLPDSGDELLGVLNLHGEILPVIDPRPRVALHSGRPQAEHRLVLLRADARFLLWVDEVDEVVDATVEALSSVPLAGPQAIHGQTQATQAQATQGQTQAIHGQTQATQAQATQGQAQATQGQTQAIHGQTQATQAQATQGQTQAAQGQTQATPLVTRVLRLGQSIVPVLAPAALQLRATSASCASGPAR